MDPLFQIRRALKNIKDAGLYPITPIVDTPHAPEMVVEGRRVLMFATNNYLDMMRDPRVISAAEVGLREWGIGNGSARLLTGNLNFHRVLESKIAKFKGRESGLTFVSGYAANEGALPALINILDPNPKAHAYRTLTKYFSSTVVFSDEYNHASIIAGIKESGARKEIFRHRDVDDLLRKMKSYPRSRRKIIVVDGVFSMDGDIAPLPQLLEIKEKYNAILYLDDAHGTGILGPSGRGVEDYFGCEGESDVVMGTFTKSFGGVGGFIVGDGELIDYLKVTARSFIFTAPIAPPVAYGIMQAIDIVEEEDWRRKAVLGNAEYLRGKLTEAGFDTLQSQTQILPVLIGLESKAVEVSRLLLSDYSIFIPCARWPAVPRGMARLRITVTCRHTREQLDTLVAALVELKNKMHF